MLNWLAGQQIDGVTTTRDEKGPFLAVMAAKNAILRPRMASR
jgi:hypothetical protein